MEVGAHFRSCGVDPLIDTVQTGCRGCWDLALGLGPGLDTVMSARGSFTWSGRAVGRRSEWLYMDTYAPAKPQKALSWELACFICQDFIPGYYSMSFF